MENYDSLCRNMIFSDDKFLISRVGRDIQDAKRLSVNCEGYGRLRYFKVDKYDDWVDNPLPMGPFSKLLGIDMEKSIPVQVFQVAKCNLNCWWCFLPNEYKVGNTLYSKWFSVDELVEMYIEDNNDAKVIDLSGGNPELVPEWVYKFMQCLEKKNLSDKVYLWSDDVLTTDFFFDRMEKKEQIYMANYQNYGKVACFKGFDQESFEYNTCSEKHSLSKQLSIAKKYIEMGFDIYFYQVLTCDDLTNIDERISNYMDALQEISVNLPLRIVPIKIKKFGANESRFNSARLREIDNQFIVLDIWKKEIFRRFGYKMFEWKIEDIAL